MEPFPQNALVFSNQWWEGNSPNFSPSTPSPPTRGRAAPISQMERQRVSPGVGWPEGRQKSLHGNLQSCTPPPKCPPHTPGLPEAAVVTIYPRPAHSLLRHPSHRACGCLQGPERPVRPQRPAQRAAEPAGEGIAITPAPCRAKEEQQQSLTPILSLSPPRHNLNTPCK